MVKKFQDRNNKGQFTEVVAPLKNVPQSMDDIPKPVIVEDTKTTHTVFDDNVSSFEFKSLTAKEVKNYIKAMDFANQQVSTPASRAAIMLQRSIIEERFGAINWAA